MKLIKASFLLITLAVTVDNISSLKLKKTIEIATVEVNIVDFVFLASSSEQFFKNDFTKKKIPNNFTKFTKDLKKEILTNINALLPKSSPVATETNLSVFYLSTFFIFFDEKIPKPFNFKSDSHLHVNLYHVKK